ncbi:hypothetical protein FA95DRAFT_209385 [Auriscalpium vulgare]|uniref:Uncharacterized protein n=1 Tax=Auriscalpium vulgare TaxID=40419 RepID=A0ACB8RMK6_9AGAM|nr:hypothetical protein FA95DRAFT_209385 [Auriscalpium vulgare]
MGAVTAQTVGTDSEAVRPMASDDPRNTGRGLSIMCRGPRRAGRRLLHGDCSFRRPRVKQTPALTVSRLGCVRLCMPRSSHRGHQRKFPDPVCRFRCVLVSLIAFRSDLTPRRRVFVPAASASPVHVYFATQDASSSLALSGCQPMSNCMSCVPARLRARWAHLWPDGRRAANAVGSPRAA